MLSPNGVLTPSFRPARIQNPEWRSRQVLSRATRRCGRRNTLAARSGDPSRQHPMDAPAGQWMERLPPQEPRRNQDALCEPKVREAKLLGQRLMARDFDRQVAEFQVRVAVLNGFTALGIPVTKAVGYGLSGYGGRPAVSRFVQQSPVRLQVDGVYETETCHDFESARNRIYLCFGKAKRFI